MEQIRNDICLNSVSKRYGKVSVIEGMNMHIKAGERLVLLGPSGCGKSTTLRMIAGLEEISDGELTMGGEIVNNIPAGKRNIAMVFQNYALYPHMTVEENIVYSLKVHKVDPEKIKNRLNTVLKILSLEDFKDRTPRELSGGQRQRVALARGLVKNAPYLLLDEPLSNLDALLRASARKELVKIHELFSQTLVYVTHDQVEAMTVGQRIALLHNGKVQMIDTPYMVYHRPTNVFVAKFIGSPPTNIIDAEYDGNTTLNINGGKYVLNEMWINQIKNYSKDKIYFGIRPEAIKLGANSSSNGLEAVLQYVEDLGSKKSAYINIGDKEIVAVCEEIPVKLGEKVYLSFPEERIHLFDHDSEENLGYPDQIPINSHVELPVV